MILNRLNWPRIKDKIIRFTLLQLFISCISLPILILWGLPISLAAPAGTLLFGPLLTLFLFVSSLLFFTELLHLPNGLFVLLLEYLSAVWYWLCSFGPKTCLVAFAKPPVWLLCLLPLTAFFIIQNRYTHPPRASIPCLVVLLCLFSFIIKTIYTNAQTEYHMPCHQKTIPIFHTHNQTVVIDPGIIGSRLSASSWVSYTFLPELVKQIGTLTIDHLIVLQPGALTYEAVTTLCTKAQVKNVYLVLWRNKLPYCAWRNFRTMCNELQAQDTTIVRTGAQLITIPLSDNEHITITPLEKELAYHEARYNALCVSGIIDNKPFTFYSAKLKYRSS